ncbi:MAG: hypothetical protein WD851_09350 [Pirellulales bacterium]
MPTTSTPSTFREVFGDVRRKLAQMPPDNATRVGLLEVRKLLLDLLANDQLGVVPIGDFEIMSTATMELPADTMQAVGALAVQAERDYRAMVFALAAGEQPNPYELREALRETGRSQADLERHVAIAKQVLQARSDVERAAQLLAQLPSLEDASRVAAEAVATKMEQQRTELQALRATAHEALGQLTSARDSARSLKSSAERILERLCVRHPQSEFDRLSDRACRLERLLAMKSSNLTTAKTAVDRLAELTTSPQLGTWHEKNELERELPCLPDVELLASEVEQLRTDATEARAALDGYTLPPFDCREVKFD